MKIVVTGSSGLVGSALRSLLAPAGHDVVRLVRREATATDEVQWSPEGPVSDTQRIDGSDALVHLAGANIGDKRWSAKRKREIRDSRIEGTQSLVRSVAKLREKPKTVVQASAIGFYGDRGDELLDESSPAGAGFLSEVCQEWEQASQPLVDEGLRVVYLRFGVILARKKSALQRMALPIKMGVGGRIGDGTQWVSWVSLGDASAAIVRALEDESLSGPVNVVAPQPATNLDLTRTLGSVLSRPTLFPLPAFAARIVLGEMAEHLLLASTRVQPGVLTERGFSFAHAALGPALRELLARPA